MKKIHKTTSLNVWIMLISGLSGFVFGLGLIISGMINPAKVLAFLDISSLRGDWNPSLALVMIGAIAVSGLAFYGSKKRHTSLLGMPLCHPAQQLFDKRLIIGAIVFGLGWGLVGLCPGPAIVSFAMGVERVWIFVVAMMAGMLAWSIVEKHINKRSTKQK